MAMRLQIAIGSRLVAEAIFETARDADRAWAAFARAKYAKGLPMGGAAIARAESPRFWNVPVGAQIPRTADALAREEMHSFLKVS